MVAVRPEYQGRGIGTLLTKTGIDIAEQLKVPVYLESDDGAVKLYERLGFEKLKTGVPLSPEVVGGHEPLEVTIMAKLPASLNFATFEDWLRKKDSVH